MRVATSGWIHGLVALQRQSNKRLAPPSTTMTMAQIMELLWYTDVGVEILNHCIKPPKTGRDNNSLVPGVGW